jgi:hypothetical protein
MAQAQQNVPLDQGTVDWFDEQAMNNPQGMVEWARQQGNQPLLMRGLQAWKEIDPYGAAVYTTNIQSEQRFAQLEQQISQQQKLPGDAATNLALQNVLNRHPEYTSFSDVLGDAIASRPHLQAQLQQAVGTGDPSQIEGIIETAYGLARGDTLYQALQAGATPETTQSMTDVVEPSTSTSHDPPPEKTPVESWKEQFRQEAERRAKGVWVAN